MQNSLYGNRTARNCRLPSLLHCFRREQQQRNQLQPRSPKGRRYGALKWILRSITFVIFAEIWFFVGVSRSQIVGFSGIEDELPTIGWNRTTGTGQTSNKINAKILLPTSSDTPRLPLRLDWTNLKPVSDLTKRMVAHQQNCSAPMGTFLYRNRFGLGSDLHVWGQALCNGMQSGLRLRTVGNWTWMDQQQCSGLGSPMLCYFHSSELNCPGDVNESMQNLNYDSSRALCRSNGIVTDQCQSIYNGTDRSQVRRSAVEFLFLHISPLVVQEAQRQLQLVFPGMNTVPKDLITVHIRWGDKEREMKLVQIKEYIQAVRQILLRRRQAASSGVGPKEEANIYLATEDPKAVEHFHSEMPSGWNLYVDQAFVELLPHRVEEYNGSPKMSKAVHGRAGLITLGSLLVAMEANDFVLTTASNWSRVVNELRQAVLDPRCGNCTTMIDLRKVRNEW